MYIAQLEFRNVRILRELSIDPGPSLNFFVGPNGGGKSSILEGIAFLGLGRSFRTRQSREAVAWGTNELLVFGRVEVEDGRQITLGVEKGSAGGRIRLGGQEVRAASELARVLPLQIITPESEQVLRGAGRHRRQLMDWALFHVEPEYFPVFQSYQRALLQRNAELRGRPGRGAGASWNRQLGDLGEALHLYRTAYVTEVRSAINAMAEELGAREADVNYEPGWNVDQPLEEELGLMTARDNLQGYTTVGPHRADLKVMINGVLARQVLSRGEARLWVASALLGQLKHLRGRTGIAPTVLMDDFGAELDAGGRSRLLGALGRMGVQAFVTGVSKEGFDLGNWADRKVFHVEQGEVAEMV